MTFENINRKLSALLQRLLAMFINGQVSVGGTVIGEKAVL